MRSSEELVTYGKDLGPSDLPESMTVDEKKKLIQFIAQLGEEQLHKCD
eukprot:gene263-26622_t